MAVVFFFRRSVSAVVDKCCGVCRPGAMCMQSEHLRSCCGDDACVYICLPVSLGIKDCVVWPIVK